MSGTDSGAQKERMAVVMLGARRDYAVPRILHTAGALDRFYTDLSCSAGLWRLVCRALPRGARKGALGRLAGRQIPGLPAERISHFPWFKLKRAWAPCAPITPAQKVEDYARHNAAFGKLVASRGLGSAMGVYAFNAAAVEVFAYAREHSMKCILDQTAAPWRIEETLMAEERERWPGWEFTGVGATQWAPLAEREAREWAMADTIICGSDYVYECMREAGASVEKCRVVSYGIDPERFKSHVRRREGLLKVLYVGTVQLRKGIQYLMQAARDLHAEGMQFRAVGPIAVSDQAVRELAEVIDLAGPVPRDQMQAEYDWADVLVLPSISEGSANVCYEALACGLPVITTANAGSVVRDGVEGYVLPIRSRDALADAMNKLASDAGKLEELSRHAVSRGREFTWERYGRELLAAMGIDQA